MTNILDIIDQIPTEHARIAYDTEFLYGKPKSVIAEVLLVSSVEEDVVRSILSSQRVNRLDGAGKSLLEVMSASIEDINTEGDADADGIILRHPTAELCMGLTAVEAKTMPENVAIVGAFHNCVIRPREKFNRPDEGGRMAFYMRVPLAFAVIENFEV